MGEIVEYLLWLSLLPVALLIVDTATLMGSRDTARADYVAPRLQFWLQDFLVFTLASSVALAWCFSKLPKDVGRQDLVGRGTFIVIASLVEVGLGFLVAVDVCAVHFGMSAKRRSVVFAVILAISVFAAWLVATLWWIWKRWGALRRGPRFCGGRARVFVAIAVMGYMVAFFLPMSATRGSTFLGDMMGRESYMICVIGFFSKDWMGLEIAWLANTFFWAACAFLLEGRRWLCVGLTVVALLLALTVHSNQHTVLTSPAYGTWFFSMAAVGVLALIGGARARVGSRE